MQHAAPLTARIQFLMHTQDERGQIVHAPGDVIIGTILRQRQDFLFVQPVRGACLWIDTSRTDWHTVELRRTGEGHS